MTWPGASAGNEVGCLCVLRFHLYTVPPPRAWVGLWAVYARGLVASQALSPFVFVYVHVVARVGLTFVIMHSPDSMTAYVYLNHFSSYFLLTSSFLFFLFLHAKENARFVYVCKAA